MTMRREVTVSTRLSHSFRLQGEGKDYIRAHAGLRRKIPRDTDRQQTQGKKQKGHEDDVQTDLPRDVSKVFLRETKSLAPENINCNCINLKLL